MTVFTKLGHMLLDFLKRIIIDSIKDPKIRTGIITASFLWGISILVYNYWGEMNVFSISKVETTCIKDIAEMQNLIDTKVTFVLLPIHENLVTNKPGGYKQKTKDLEKLITDLTIIRYSELFREEKNCQEGKLPTANLIDLKREILSKVGEWEIQNKHLTQK